MTRGSAVAGSVRQNGRIRVVASCLLAVAAVLAASMWGGCGDDQTAPSSGSEPVATTAVTVPTVETGIGRPVDTGSFVIEILSVGPSDLEMLPPQPEPGHHFLGVVVEVVNQGAGGVPLNGIPYSSGTAQLVADGVEYPGKLYIRPGPLLQGEVPPGRSIKFTLVFEIPYDTQEATFVWNPVPAVSGYPVIAVAIPEGVLQGG